MDRNCTSSTDLIGSALDQMKTILSRQSIEKKPMKIVQTPNATSSVADDSTMKHQQIDALLLENAHWKSERRALAQRFLTAQASPSSRSSYEQTKTCEIDAMDRQYHETIIKQKEAQLDAHKSAYRELRNVCEQHESQREALERAVTRCQFDREELMDDVADLKAELKTTNAQNQQLAACIMEMETLSKQRTDEIKKCDTTLVKATHTVHSAMDCDIMASRDLNGQMVSIHAYPRFTGIVQLWGGNGRYNTIRSFCRQQVAATRTQIGKDTRDAAVNKAVHTARSLWPGLQLIQWSELHNIPGITVYTAQTLLRLKANRLSMWNYEKADLSCSNPECPQVVQSSVQHLFWECPKAKLVWNCFYALRAKIGITPGHDPAIWIFSLDLPDTPRHAWTTIKRHIIGHKFSNEHLQDHLYPVAHMLWRYMSASLIQTIWCAHLRRMDPDPIESTAEMAIMMTRLEAGMRNLTRLAEAQAGGSDGHTVVAVLKAYVDCFLSQTDAIPLTPSDTRGVYLLFFDGGSRGNPGP
ncbi:hypothetical protein FI667_g1039, partial [Globisporangium splendens]